MIGVLRAGGLYFALVFAAGFALGAIRVSWVAPRIGARMAELLETPLMVLVSFVAARWLVRHFRGITGAGRWLAIGLVGLALMLLVEFTAVLWLRGLSIADYLAQRDPLTSVVYFAALGAFAILPVLLSRTQGGGR